MALVFFIARYYTAMPTYRDEIKEYNRVCFPLVIIVCMRYTISNNYFMEVRTSL